MVGHFEHDFVTCQPLGKCKDCFFRALLAYNAVNFPMPECITGGNLGGAFLYHIVKRNEGYVEYINQCVGELSLPTKVRKDAVLMASFVIGSDREFFKRLDWGEDIEFFKDCTEYFAKRYGLENIISAVVHVDETTPHLHLNLIPITNGRLCCKDLFNRKALQELQTGLYEEVGKKWGLERGKEGSQRKHLSTAEFKAKKIIEQAEAIKQENQVYADALEEAKSGEFSRNKSKLKQQAIAAVAENADLKKRLDKSMGETLEYAKKAEALERQKDTDSHYVRVGKTLAKSNPKEYERIIRGKPKTIGNFFDSVLSLFTPEVTRQVPRLQQIEAELEEERKKQEKQSNNNNFNGK